jgi:hypothetical protein
MPLPPSLPLVPPRAVFRPFARFVVALFLSVVSLGGSGARVVGMGGELGCAHDQRSSSGTPAHMEMSQAADMDERAMRDAGASGRTSGSGTSTPCCASDQAPTEAPPAPCSTHEGAMPCGAVQVCATTAAMRPAAAAMPMTRALPHGTPVPAPALRVEGPAIAPDVPPPRGESPIWS